MMLAVQMMIFIFHIATGLGQYARINVLNGGCREGQCFHARNPDFLEHILIFFDVMRNLIYQTF